MLIDEKIDLNVIYIDDDTDDWECFSEAIKEVGINYNLTLLNSCTDLIKLLGSGKPVDIIFLDINMPVNDGKQCLKILKDNPSYKSIPIIMLSVSNSTCDIDDVYELGAHYHVIKPYAHLNFVATLKLIFGVDWKQPQPIPAKDKFLINLAYT